MYPLLMTLLMMFLAGPVEATAPLPPLVDLPDGTACFTYPTRDGVEGDCDGFVIRQGDDTTISHHRGHHRSRHLAPGPAQVTFRVQNGDVRRLEVAVGDCMAKDGARDLGEVTGAVAAAWLLDLAERARPEVGEDALTAATLARGADPAPGLLAVVRDRDRDADLREHALHLLAALAGSEVIDPVRDLLADPDEDIELREAAVFALSQLDDEAALDHLLGIGREHDDPRLQRAAIFALSQYDDERVVSLYADILLDE